MDAPDTLMPSTALSLMLAVIATSDTPLLLLDGRLRVLAASGSFCSAFDIDPQTIEGKLVLSMGDGEWNLPQLGSLLSATATGAANIHAYELDLRRPKHEVRHLVLNAHRLDYEDKVKVRLLLAVADVTRARANEKLKDDLIREKAVLLREVQHRIANSLQIIASVLLQSARRVVSEEARGHLKDAHGRVMSIASVQRQLAQSVDGDVVLRPYLTQLCASLSASMIEDPERLSIALDVDDAVVNSDTSISLGLIVTELVINALKHAFPYERGGQIDVRYDAQGAQWTLSVSDNGIGISTDPKVAKAGLGTSIVEAIASQLGAEIRVGDSRPGTTVRIIHSGAAESPTVQSL